MSDQSPSSSSSMLKGCLFAFLGVMLALVIIAVAIFAFTSAIFKSVTKEDMTFTVPNIQKTYLEGSPYGSDGFIGVIKVSGVITSSKGGSGSTSCHDVQEIVDYLLSGQEYGMKALIVQVDSPGGEVTASDIIHHAFSKIQEQKIPVIVQMESMAASGGYYISSNADRIIANPTTLTGSIGVIISGYNVVEGMHKLGIKNQVFTSGAFKDMLSPTRDMSDPEVQYVQEMVNQSYDRFVDLVSKGRGISREKLTDMHAIDGRIISGEDAKKMGLVDSLGYWGDVLKTARDISKSTPDTAIIKFDKKPSFSDLLFDLGIEATTPRQISVEIGNTSFPKLKPGMIYMLPAVYATGTIVQ